MSAAAIVMMVIAILVVWGGMISAMIRLRHHPDPSDNDD